MILALLAAATSVGRGEAGTIRTFKAFVGFSFLMQVGIMFARAFYLSWPVTVNIPVGKLLALYSKS